MKSIFPGDSYPLHSPSSSLSMQLRHVKTKLRRQSSIWVRSIYSHISSNEKHIINERNRYLAVFLCIFHAEPFLRCLPHRAQKRIHGEGLRNHSKQIPWMRSYRLHSISGLFLPTDSDNRSGLKRPTGLLPFRKLRKDYGTLSEIHCGPFQDRPLLSVSPGASVMNWQTSARKCSFRPAEYQNPKGREQPFCSGDVRLSTRPLYPGPGRKHHMPLFVYRQNKHRRRFRM